MFKKLLGKLEHKDIKQMQEKRDIKGLMKALAYKQDKYIRNWAAEALGEIGDPEAIDALRDAFYNDKEDMFDTAGKALLMINDPRVMDIFRDALGSNKYAESVFRLAELQKGGKPLDSRVIEPLVNLLRNKAKRDATSMKSMPMTIVEILGRLDDPKVVEPLIEALGDEDGYVRKYAVEALGKINNPKAVRPLISLLFRFDGTVGVDEVSTALNRIDPKWIESEWVKEGIAKLIVQFRENGGRGSERSPFVVLSRLPWVPKDDFERTLQLAMKKKWQEVERIGEAAVEPLILLLNDTGDEIDRTAVIATLATLGDARAVKPLLKILEYHPILPRQFNRSGLSMAAQTAILKIGKSAVDTLLAEYNDSTIQSNIAIYLGEIGDARAAGPLFTTAVNSQVWAKEAIGLLEKTLDQYVSEMDEETLQRLASLNGVFQEEKSGNEFGYTTATWRVEVDCSKLNQLAKQELVRRGMAFD
ncbi:MAG: HEAT repeat domain-containing protein [Anaerolineae bacterium]|nr:HEAT repeat domain-containing protein [Anaerolineae bacterium]